VAVEGVVVRISSERDPRGMGLAFVDANGESASQLSTLIQIIAKAFDPIPSHSCA
jgi:hypothetical protein